jgi:dienelactone hydrolase
MNHIGRFLCLLIIGCNLSSTAQAVYTLDINELTTPKGTRFSVVGNKPAKPAPTLFLFGSTASDTILAETLGKLGQLLERDGYITVSVDLPEHGPEMREDVPALHGWADRLKKGDNWVPGYMAKLSEVLDYLVSEGYTDPNMVVTLGTSRGGFIALHFAAAEPRVQAVMAISPVTDLRALREFTGLEDNKLTESVSAVHAASALVGRPIWICIGNNDTRVSTASSIEFMNAVVNETVRRNPSAPAEESIPIRLDLMPWPGHFSPESAHDTAYDWLREQQRPASSPSKP